MSHSIIQGHEYRRGYAEEADDDEDEEDRDDNDEEV